MFATQMGKHIIGYRTEMRTPYGALSDVQGGMHTFCYFPCHDFFLYSNQAIGNREQGIKVMDTLAAEIDAAIQKKKGLFKQETTPYA
mmetsp:Transcript_28576/g.21336  ORF Transcript_28576/g.21336 Transcript_28576/m.21336 type:complete len:87 (+) Transcript_28576:303-563(+)